MPKVLADALPCFSRLPGLRAAVLLNERSEDIALRYDPNQLTTINDR
jgi:hypothetical protein